jgi:multiple sugar transport system permease protein
MDQPASIEKSRRPRWRKLTRMERHNLRVGLLFISPWIIGFLIFNLYPMIMSLYYSFTDFQGILVANQTWYANYAAMFRDERFWNAVRNTIYMVLIAVPLNLVFSLLCAILLNLKVRGQSFYRVMFFLPSIVPAIAATMLWIWILKPDNGLLSTLLSWFGVQSPNWFLDPLWSKPALILMGIWGIGGTIIIYLSGLQDVSQTLLESAELDGANWWQRLRNITIPMVSPITLFNLITGVIFMFQYFSQAYVFARFASIGKAEITVGRPMDSTLFYSVFLYDKFTHFRYGYASAMAWVLFIVILLCTVALLKASNRFTYYAG